MKNLQLLEETTQNPQAAKKALEAKPNGLLQETEAASQTTSDDDGHNNQNGEDEDDLEGMLTLPMSRIKKIVKLDPEHISSTESANYLLGVAAELFVKSFTSQAASIARSKKRKKIQYADFHDVVSSAESMLFLKDLVPKTVPLKELLSEKKVKLRPDQQALLERVSSAQPQVNPTVQQTQRSLPPIQPQIASVPEIQVRQTAVLPPLVETRSGEKYPPILPKDQHPDSHSDSQENLNASQADISDGTAKNTFRRSKISDILDRENNEDVEMKDA
ncbi:hypothetical protein BRETT_004573 [Brettanomyces bruxellensis]|uniref:Transcription factor CBF/NF-Y/archaeal histone domain-containing protein n=1 Tax=Dekkera bruxellensis TaxID=5007 RepID=A0A871R3Q8_DEKBR|nr:uncharacterized protein BRETT_004573 [Brettanomyces bruxellensis]QOU19926.1 hypothetical protein BRETT_004573 [Brettanomyces bruxellensis]